MSELHRILSFLFVGFILSSLTFFLDSSFIDNFSKNILALLTTLLAINIASSTLISIEIRAIQNLTGADFPKSKKNLKSTLYEQIILIYISLIVSIFRESCYLKSILPSNLILIISDSVLFFCFIYYLDIILDIGKSLYDLLDFKFKKDN